MIILMTGDIWRIVPAIWREMIISVTRENSMSDFGGGYHINRGFYHCTCGPR